MTAAGRAALVTAAGRRLLARSPLLADAGVVDRLTSEQGSLSAAHERAALRLAGMDVSEVLARALDVPRRAPDARGEEASGIGPIASTLPWSPAARPVVTAGHAGLRPRSGRGATVRDRAIEAGSPARTDPVPPGDRAGEVTREAALGSPSSAPSNGAPPSNLEATALGRDRPAPAAAGATSPSLRSRRTFERADPAEPARPRPGLERPGGGAGPLDGTRPNGADLDRSALAGELGRLVRRWELAERSSPAPSATPGAGLERRGISPARREGSESRWRGGPAADPPAGGGLEAGLPEADPISTAASRRAAGPPAVGPAEAFEVALETLLLREAQAHGLEDLW